MDKKEKDTFNYTYSAKEQEEIKAIRQKYVSQKTTENKMEQLRRLDLSVNQKANVVSLVLGIIGTLILGTGMSIIMTDIGKIIGLSHSLSMLVGILMGVVGIVLVALAYPIYNGVIKKERKKIAPLIIELTDELMK
jgi:hypothetical protein